MSSCSCYIPDGRLPSPCPPTASLSSPWAALHPNSGPHPGLQPRLLPKRHTHTQPPRTLCSPPGLLFSPVSDVCKGLQHVFRCPVQERGSSFPRHRTSDHILDSSGTCSSPSSCLHLCVSPGTSSVSELVPDFSLMAANSSIPPHTYGSGKANVQYTLVSNHLGAL